MKQPKKKHKNKPKLLGIGGGTRKGGKTGRDTHVLQHVFSHSHTHRNDLLGLTSAWVLHREDRSPEPSCSNTATSAIGFKPKTSGESTAGKDAM